VAVFAKRIGWVIDIYIIEATSTKEKIKDLFVWKPLIFKELIYENWGGFKHTSLCLNL
jgi:hypothetical protein